MLSEEDRKRLADLGNPERLRTMDDFVRLGRYCLLVLVAAEFMTLTSLANMVFMVYAGSAPTPTKYGNFSIPEGKLGCTQYEQLKKDHPGLKTEFTEQFHSVNVEFGLFCHDIHDVKSSISIQMAGVLIGAFFAGAASDHFGRRFTLIISLIGISIFSFLVAKATTLNMFTFARFLCGIFTGGLTAVQGVFLIENIPRKHRLWINTVITWSPNFIIFPPIAYLCYDWRTLSYFTSAAAFATTLSLYILEESPRWRVSRGQIGPARKSLARINRIDGYNDPEEAEHLERMLQNEKEMHEARVKEASSHQFIRLVKSKKYLMWLGTISFGIVVASLLNYGLMFNMEKLSGSLYWNNIVFGIIRWFVNIAAGLCDYFFTWFGRKMINSTAMMYMIPSLAAIFVIIQGEFAEYAWLARYSTIGVTALTSQLYLAKFIIASELFPTSVRNIVASVLAVFSRTATILAPQLFYLGEITPSLPFGVMLIAAAVDAIAFQCLLPETKGSNLLNRIPDKKEENLLSRKQSIAEA